MTTVMSRRSFLARGGALAAGVAATGALGACSSKPGKSGPVEIEYQYFMSKDLKDINLVQDAMNKRLKALGKSFTVKLNPLAAATYKQRMPLAFAAGSAGDVFFTAPWMNDFYGNASAGDYLALDDLLPKYAPGLWKSFTPDIWETAKVGGKLYGAINQQVWPYSYGFVGRQDICQKYGLDADAITTWSDLTPYFKEIKAGEKNMTVWMTDSSGHGGPATMANAGGWDSLGYGLAVMPDDENLKVFAVEATDWYRQQCELVRGWHLAGYTAPNPPSSTDATAAWNNGQIAFNGSEQANGVGLPPFPVVAKRLQELVLTTGTVAATLTGVNRDTKHPREAVEFIELLNTDKEFFNTICFGVEGKHYVFTDKALGVVGFPAGLTATNDPYNPNSDWEYGNQFNAYYRSEADAKNKVWDTQRALNQNAKRSKALGFSPVIDSVKTQAAAVTSVRTQYGQSAALGLVDTTNAVKTLLDQLKAAGQDKLKDELQRQIDKWASSK